MLKFGKLHRKSPHVNMIPVINVIFLLLIYFLMQGSFKQVDSIAVNVPVSKSGKTVTADPIILYISPAEFALGKEKFAENSLSAKLAKLKKDNSNTQLLLKADASLDSTKLISVLQTIKQSGITNIYMVTTAPKTKE